MRVGQKVSEAMCSIVQGASCYIHKKVQFTNSQLRVLYSEAKTWSLKNTPPLS